MGVWMEELRRGLESRYIPWPCGAGRRPTPPTGGTERGDLPRCLDELDEFLAGGGSTRADVTGEESGDVVPDPRAHRVAALVGDAIVNERAAGYDALAVL